MVLNCGVVKTIESPLDCTRLNQSIERRSVLNIHWKDWCWSWNSNPLATWCEELTHWKRPWCWKRLKAGREEKTEDEMVGWHHWLDGHELDQALRLGEGQGSLVCCHSWGRRVRHDWAELRDPRRFQSEFKWSKKVAAGTRSLCFRFMTNNFLHK